VLVVVKSDVHKFDTNQRHRADRLLFEGVCSDDDIATAVNRDLPVGNHERDGYVVCSRWRAVRLKQCI